MVFVTSTLLGDSPFWAIAKSSSLEDRNAASKEMRRDSGGDEGLGFRL